MQRRARLGLTAAAFLCLSLQGSAAPPFPAGFVAAFRWVTDDDLLGGLSAIEVSADGLRFIALSDRGAITEGTFTRDAEGRITEVTAPPMLRLKGDGDAPLKLSRSDSEGLVWAPDGTIFVSFEGVSRLLSYATIDARAENLPRPGEFRAMQENSSLEALAMDAQGRLYTLPERSGAEDRPFPVYRFEDGTWTQPFSIARIGEFLPVAADFGPDGRLYLLERNFLGFAGFASRVRVFDLGPSSALEGVIILETAAGVHDNLEGLSVWQDTAGNIRLTMVSDDNFQFYLRSEIVEYLLPVDAVVLQD